MPRGMPPAAMRALTARVAVSITDTVFDSQLDTYAVDSSGAIAITFGQAPPALNESTYERSSSRKAWTMPVVIWLTHSSPRPGRNAISTKPTLFGHGSGGDRVVTFAKVAASKTSMPGPSSRAERMYRPSGVYSTHFGCRPVAMSATSARPDSARSSLTSTSVSPVTPRMICRGR